MTADAVVVPSTLAMLPAYAGIEDPIADLRSACRAAVAWLVERHPDRLTVVTAEVSAVDVARGVTDPPGARIARHLLIDAGFTGDLVGSAPGVLVVANGSATREERAPGHLDARAAAFDAVIGAALSDGDPEALRSLDCVLGGELWCHDVPALQALGTMVEGVVTAETTYAGAPFGVQYWVTRWKCAS